MGDALVADSRWGGFAGHHEPWSGEYREDPGGTTIQAKNPVIIFINWDPGRSLG